MKKRVISFLMVLTFIFTGVFSCVASADQGVGERLFNFWFDAQDDFDVFGISKPSRDFMRGFLYDYLFEQENTHQSEQSDFDLGSGILVPGRLYQDSRARVDSAVQESDKNYWLAVPPENALKCMIYPDALVTFSMSCDSEFVFYYQLFGNSGTQIVQSSYRSANADSVSYHYTGNTVLYAYLRYQVTSTRNGGVYYNNSDDPNKWSGLELTVTAPDNKFQWGWDLSLFWSARFEEHPLEGLNIDLTTSRALITDDGDFLVSYGVIYRPDDDLTYAGPFVEYETINTGNEWTYNINLSEFVYYVYRKHCGLKDFRAFISVRSNKENKCVLFKYYDLDLKPFGIFDDVQESPDWKDYEPDPSDPPDPPSFDTNIFNYTFNTNNYVFYNFQTIQNFSYSGGGGSGGGGGGTGTGNDDSSSVDDSSSGGDSSGGDSSVDDSGFGGGVNINPDIDFDFGLLTAFLNWFADAFAALLGNLTGFFGAMLNNFKLLLDDLFKFYNDFSSYLIGYFNDWLEYFSQLIINFNTDFNNWGSSFATYIGDCIDLTDFNIQIIVSNLKQYFETQFIPDSDNVNFILSDCLGWYYQIKQLLASKSYSSAVFTLSFGDFGTFTLDDPQLFSQIRSLIGVIVMGCTAIKCLRLGFQMFGINIGGGDSDDS